MLKIIKREFNFMAINVNSNVLIFFVAILIVGCSKQSSLEKEVAAKMLDPSSVEFRKTYITKSEPTVFCGEINAKNTLGGYVGYKKFYYVTGNLSMPPDAPDEPFLQVFTDLSLSATSNTVTQAQLDSMRELTSKYGFEKTQAQTEIFKQYFDWINSYVNICKEG